MHYRVIRISEINRIRQHRMTTRSRIQPHRILHHTSLKRSTQLINNFAQRFLLPTSSLILGFFQKLCRERLKNTVSNLTLIFQLNSLRCSSLIKSFRRFNNQTLTMTRRTSLIHHSSPSSSLSNWLTRINNPTNTRTLTKHRHQISTTKLLRRTLGSKIRKRITIRRRPHHCGNSLRQHRSTTRTTATATATATTRSQQQNNSNAKTPKPGKPQFLHHSELLQTIQPNLAFGVFKLNFNYVLNIGL